MSQQQTVKNQEEYVRIHARLRDLGELLKLHLKHYHINLESVKHRTNRNHIPNPQCQKPAPVPSR
eukprot:12921624-Prorocentrum_lima.AAC.1